MLGTFGDMAHCWNLVYRTRDGPHRQIIILFVASVSCHLVCLEGWLGGWHSAYSSICFEGLDRT